MEWAGPDDTDLIDTMVVDDVVDVVRLQLVRETPSYSLGGCCSRVAVVQVELSPPRGSWKRLW